MHTTGKPSDLRACQSQTEVAPVSSPILMACGAFERISWTSLAGSEGMRPSNATTPFASSTHTLVSLSETSRATYWSMAALLVLMLTKADPNRPCAGESGRPDYHPRRRADA